MADCYGPRRLGTRRLAALVYGLPPGSGMSRFWGVSEELAAVQVEMIHELQRTLIWTGRIHLDKADQKKVKLPEPLRIPRPFDDVTPTVAAPEPPRMTRNSIRAALLGIGG